MDEKKIKVGRQKYKKGLQRECILTRRENMNTRKCTRTEIIITIVNI
jgi:hypothetical protein